jgi:hypothetical protein
MSEYGNSIIRLKNKLIVLLILRRINKQSEGDDQYSLLSLMVVFEHSKIAVTENSKTFVAPCWSKISS